MEAAHGSAKPGMESRIGRRDSEARLDLLPHDGGEGMNHRGRPGQRGSRRARVLLRAEDDQREGVLRLVHDRLCRQEQGCPRPRRLTRRQRARRPLDLSRLARPRRPTSLLAGVEPAGWLGASRAVTWPGAGGAIDDRLPLSVACPSFPPRRPSAPSDARSPAL
jgi:hypothetical protein